MTTEIESFDSNLWIMDGDYIVCSKETFSKIQEFTRMHPGSSYGPAHIVLDDNNLMDEHIRFCLDNCREWLANKEGDAIEIQATIAFLEKLLEIPEDDR